MLLFCYINDTKKYLTEIVFKTAGMQHSLGPIVVVSYLYLASLSFCLFAQTEYLYFCILCYLCILLSTWCRCISPRLWVWLSGASPIASQSAKTFFVVTFIFWIMHPIMFVCLPVWMHFFYYYKDTGQMEIKLICLWKYLSEQQKNSTTCARKWRK